MSRRIVLLLLALAIVGVGLSHMGRGKAMPAPPAATQPADVTYDSVPGTSSYRIRSLPAVRVIEQSLARSSDEQLLAMLHGAALAAGEDERVDYSVARDGNSMIEYELRKRGLSARAALEAHKDDSRPIFAGDGMPPTVGALCAELLAEWTPPASLTREQRLILAANNGDPRWVAKLIAEGANVNARFGEAGKNAPPAALRIWADWTPLIALGRNEQAFDPLGTAMLLVEAGASVDLADEDGNTPLSYVVSNDWLDLARYLLEHGADVKARDRYGRVPLSWRDPRMLALLLSHGADLNNRNIQGETALFVSNHDPIPRAIKALIDAGADVNVANDEGQTPLHIARTAEIARMLIEAGARVDVKDAHGFTPLMSVEWSVESMNMQRDAVEKAMAAETGRFFLGVIGPHLLDDPDRGRLENAGLSGQMLAHRLNDIRSTQRKGVAAVLKAAGAK
ncbi:MAG TPA: ankyrin repeat domain-containing protein [Humisphaera sp.]|jgi:hypothetical protein|nr:ankyrin repeat domain-containing protein [Humisphaera sp.]